MGKLVEGLWDCPYCDTTSIKASQKTCPNCGHPQDENTVFRMPDTISYVSDEDAAKISQNPDWQCSFCGSLNKDIDNSCNNCGASKEESEKNYFEMRRERDVLFVIFYICFYFVELRQLEVLELKHPRKNSLMK